MEPNGLYIKGCFESYAEYSYKENNMKKMLFMIFTFIVFLISGCGILENSLTDISGWDLSACVDGFDTCYELFDDNSDLIFSGTP